MSEKERRDYRSLGEILSDARRERDLTVQQVSEKTKIAPRLIVSFENDELDNLSGPVYARGFLRSLCELYDLDRAWMMSKLEAGLETADPAPAELIPPTPAPRIEGPDDEEEPAAESATGPSEQTWKIEKVDNARVRRIRPQARRRMPRWLIGVLALLVVVLLVVLFGRSLFRGDSTASDQPPQTVTAPEREEPAPGEIATERTEESAEPSADSTPSTAGTTEPPADPRSDESSASASRKAVRSAGTREGAEERVLYRDGGSDGLPSIVRRGPDAELPTMTLRVEAVRTLELRVVVDEDRTHERVLRAGESWVVEGHESFSLELSDERAAIVELDGIRRSAPPGLEAPWVLQANTVSPGSD